MSKYSVTNVTVDDFDVLGKMVVASVCLTKHDALFLDSTEMVETTVKRQLADQLIKYIIENKLIEFTRSTDIYNDTILFKARVCVTPDTTVRTLRRTRL